MAITPAIRFDMSDGSECREYLDVTGILLIIFMHRIWTAGSLVNKRKRLCISGFNLE